MSKSLIVTFVLAFLLFTTLGCSFLDSAFGIDKNGENKPGVEKPGGSGSPAGSIGGLLGLWFPWAATAISGLGGLYASFRKRQYSKALSAVVRGVNVAVSEKAQDGKINIDHLMGALADEQGSKGMPIRELVRKVVSEESKD